MVDVALGRANMDVGGGAAGVVDGLDAEKTFSWLRDLRPKSGVEGGGTSSSSLGTENMAKDWV